MKRGSVRWWLAVALLLLLGVTFMGMGRWQLSRAEERRAIAAQIERGRHANPVRIHNGMNADNVTAWQSAQATGQWLPEYTVLLDNRAQQGRPGLWMAMPMRLEGGAVLLVLRGWLARPLAGQGEYAIVMVPATPVTVRGEIGLHVPRLYELAQDPPLSFDSVSATGQIPVKLDLMSVVRRQNLSIADLSNALPGNQILPFVLLQTGDDTSIQIDGQSLLRQWPEPSVDADKNIGYAMQWFMFASIALGALVVLLWRTRRRATITS